jgi:hypothetical protein
MTTPTGGTPVFIRFVPAHGSPYRQADIQVIGEELYKLAKSEGGIKPERIVEIAKPAQSPLHQYFQWNNTKAADFYREGQARRMAASVMISYTSKEGGRSIEKRVRALHFVVQKVLPNGQTQSVPVNKEDDLDSGPAIDPNIQQDPEITRPRITGKDQRRVLIPLDRVVDDENYINQIVVRALLEFLSARAKYEHFFEHCPVFKTKFKKLWEALDGYK